tara:strand:- start:371 stop:553 length:183 start_codon:yes stop_codon:yes gene_type:complete
MTLQQAKKILDALGWVVGTGTRKLPPEDRLEVKSALNVYASAGKSYTANMVKSKSKPSKS